MTTTLATATLQEQKSSTAEAHEKFFWTYTEEPHRTRRQAIIKAHPEVDEIILLN